MADSNPEPNPQMGNLLKAYAKKRREAAGNDFEMHPATRNLLQDEVHRTFFHQEKIQRDRLKPRFGFFAWLRGPRAALVASLLLFGGIFALLFLKSPLRQQESMVNAEKSVVVAQKSEKTASPLTASPALRRSLNIPSAQSADQKEEEKTEARRDSSPQETSVGAGLKPASTSPGPFSDQVEVGSQDKAVRSQYVRVSSVGTGLKPAPTKSASMPSEELDGLAAYAVEWQKILTSFSVEQMGNQIKIVDADGSIYLGKIESGQTQSKTTNNLKESQTLPVSFRAQGTSKALNQVVEIEGKFVSDSENTNLVKGANGKTPALSSRIQAHIRIGGTGEFEIQAVLEEPSQRN